MKTISSLISASSRIFITNTIPPVILVLKKIQIKKHTLAFRVLSHQLYKVSTSCGKFDVKKKRWLVNWPKKGVLINCILNAGWFHYKGPTLSFGCLYAWLGPSIQLFTRQVSLLFINMHCSLWKHRGYTPLHNSPSMHWVKIEETPTWRYVGCLAFTLFALIWLDKY